MGQLRLAHGQMGWPMVLWCPTRFWPVSRFWPVRHFQIYFWKVSLYFHFLRIVSSSTSVSMFFACDPSWIIYKWPYSIRWDISIISTLPLGNISNEFKYNDIERSSSNTTMPPDIYDYMYSWQLSAPWLLRFKNKYFGRKFICPSMLPISHQTMRRGFLILI